VDFARRGFREIWEICKSSMDNLKLAGKSSVTFLFFTGNDIELSKHKREITNFDNNRPLLFMPSK